MKVGYESVTICIISKNRSILTEDQRIGSPHECGAIRDLVSNLHHGFFMGQGNVGPDKPRLWQTANYCFQILRFNVHGHVIPIDPIGSQPVVLDLRRPRMGHRASDDPGQRYLGKTH